MRKLLALALPTVACATAGQSATPLPVGKVQVSVGAGRVANFEENTDEGLWGANAMVRVGVHERADLGIHVAHSVGAGGYGAVGIDPKVLLGRSGPAVLSAGLPLGLMFLESSSGVDLREVGVAPTLYVGLEVSPTFELVGSARLVLDRHDDATGFSEAEYGKGFGATVGLRFTDPQRTRAVQPEVGILHDEESTLLLFGLTLSAGN